MVHRIKVRTKKFIKLDDEAAFWIRAINYNKTKSEWDKGVHNVVLKLLTRISELEGNLETDWTIAQLLSKIAEQVEQIDKLKKEYFEAGGFYTNFEDYEESKTYKENEK